MQHISEFSWCSYLQNVNFKLDNKTIRCVKPLKYLFGLRGKKNAFLDRVRWTNPSFISLNGSFFV